MLLSVILQVFSAVLVVYVIHNAAIGLIERIWRTQDNKHRQNSKSESQKQDK